jgi:hypothetical protein
MKSHLFRGYSLIVRNLFNCINTFLEFEFCFNEGGNLVGLLGNKSLRSYKLLIFISL